MEMANTGEASRGGNVPSPIANAASAGNGTTGRREKSRATSLTPGLAG